MLSYRQSPCIIYHVKASRYFLNFSSGGLNSLSVPLLRDSFAFSGAQFLSGLLNIRACCLIIALFCFSPYKAIASETVVRQDDCPLGRALNLPLYTWRDPQVAPKAVIVTIHGVTLHGAVFDKLNASLAQEGYLVVSPDLRGFGRWYLGEANFVADGSVSFFKVRADLIRLLANLNNQYGDKPLFIIGESLGANLALWLASACPQYMDGAIVSSPCVKRRLDLCPTLVVDTFKAAASPHRQVPTTPYARRFLSEDPRIVESYLNDPMIRKTMNIYESLQSFHTAKTSLWFVDQIPANIPILVVEGTKDKMFDSKQIVPLLNKMKVSDKNVCWLKGKGHIHLETPHVSDQLVKTISIWLSDHTASSNGETQQAAILSKGDSGTAVQEEN